VHQKKGGRYGQTKYRLTTCGGVAGKPFASALHKWCHAHGNCPCGNST